ncbi:MAG: hypothetical protein AAGF59_08300 [Pseudomonadota bacterium]
MASWALRTAKRAARRALAAGFIAMSYTLAALSSTFAAQDAPTADILEAFPMVETMRPVIEAELRTPLAIGIEELYIDGSWAFLITTFRGADGPIDWSKTVWIGGIEEGDCGGYAIGLFEYLSHQGGWTLVTYDVCATDVPWLNWSERFGAPASLFPQ